MDKEKIAKLMEKNNFKWSWYTEYPPIPFWKEDFLEKNYKKALDSLISNNNPLSLYIHLPFCPKRCFFCCCFTKTTADDEEIKEYLNYLFKEIEMLKDFFDKKSFIPNIKLIHLGGGSPSYLGVEKISSLIKKISSLVDIDKLKEFSIEIDPRTTTKEDLIKYSELGINRISLGIQDFNIKVQKAVNRIQSIDKIKELMSFRNYFKNGINFDVIYGLPFQTRETFKNTIKKIIEFSPDKISMALLFYNPDLLKHQKLMDKSKIPSFYENSLMFLDAYEEFLKAGYLKIGIDHFAKPIDNLGIALKKKELGRSSMGYTWATEDLIGLGAWAMGRINNYNVQNTHSLKDYYSLIQNKKFPIFRGYILNREDVIRREVINNIICHSSVDFKNIEKKYEIDFKEHFKEELKSMSTFVENGTVELFNDSFKLTYLGSFFQRHVCSIFDSFFKKQEYKHSMEVFKK